MFYATFGIPLLFQNHMFNPIRINIHAASTHLYLWKNQCEKKNGMFFKNLCKNYWNSLCI